MGSLGPTKYRLLFNKSFKVATIVMAVAHIGAVHESFNRIRQVALISTLLGHTRPRLDWFGRFCTVQGRNQRTDGQTDRQTDKSYGTMRHVRSGKNTQ